MTELFIKILNMTISASWLILAVLFLRIMLKKAPRWVNVLLWGIVAIRLISPFSIESTLSLIPSAEVVSPSALIETPAANTGFPEIDDAVNPIIDELLIETATEKSGNAMKILLRTSSRIWVAGVVLLMAYTVITYCHLRRKVNTAVLFKENIFQSEMVRSPFVLGVFKPRIYLPVPISRQSLSHVIAHEQAHIRRKDHWWKPLGFLLLAIHWFNPLMWLAYILLCRDIELACDEKVIKELRIEDRADYSAALLACSVSRHSIAACPVAFGEVSVKTRVKSVLSYKKPAFWVVVIAIVLCAVIAVCFLTNPIGSDREPDLSFLNYENAIPLAGYMEDVQVIYCPADRNETESFIKIGHILGEDLASYLDACRWREVNAPMVSLSSPGSIEFVIKDDYRITVYDRKEWSLRRYVKVSYQEDVRYYAANASDYNAALDLIDVSRENENSVTAGQYYLMIGAEGVRKIRVTTPSGSETQRNTLGLPFTKGQEVHLKALDGVTDLRGVSISAFGAGGEIIYAFSVPEGATNAEIINIVGADGWLLAPTVAIGAEEDGQYYHIISADGVAELKLTGTNFGGGCTHADGSTFQNGERVWLEPLNGYTDLQDVVVTALDKDGNILYSFLLVPKEAENAETDAAVITGSSDPMWIDGIAFVDLGSNEEQTSDFEISLVKDINTVQYSITWARTGLTLEYGLRSSDGIEYYSSQEGGQDNGQFEKIPAGTYRFFVRNTDYTGVPAYENPAVFPDVSFEATGVINFRIP